MVPSDAKVKHTIAAPITKDGKVFYFNSRTSEKTWDPPVDNGGRNWDPSKEKDGGANSWAAY